MSEWPLSDSLKLVTRFEFSFPLLNFSTVVLLAIKNQLFHKSIAT